MYNSCCFFVIYVGICCVHEQVIVHLSASNDDFQNEFVVQAFEVARRGFTTDI